MADWLSQLHRRSSSVVVPRGQPDRRYHRRDSSLVVVGLEVVRRVREPACGASAA
jgi:hypothetical protein